MMKCRRFAHTQDGLQLHGEYSHLVHEGLLKLLLAAFFLDCYFSPQLQLMELPSHTRQHDSESAVWRIADTVRTLSADRMVALNPAKAAVANQRLRYQC